MLRGSLALSCVLLVLAVACGSSGRNGGFTGGSSSSSGGFGDDAAGGPDATLIGPDGSIGGGDSGSVTHTCNPTSLDLEGCSCAVQGVGATRTCYTGPRSTLDDAGAPRGQCKLGSQSCVGSSEAPQWGPCKGSVLPSPPVCDNPNVDADCSGKTGCNDPNCANTPLCKGCSTEGATRPCYDGPTGTENVGICKDGTQTCTNGMWGACTGEVLPAPWQPSFCCDAVDHECNGVIGCFNLFQCITAACCQSSCDAGAVDPGCVCMTGSGDTATCPQGDHYVHKGGLPGTDECCPCTANDCGNENCCGESVCAGNANCSGYTCNPLPASCNGQVSADCDDFPEDCDEPCCECTQGC